MITTKLVLATRLCVVLCSLLVGCGSDDNSPTTPSRDMELVGDWKVTMMSTEYDGESETYTESQLDSLGIVWTLGIEDDGAIEQTTNLSGPMLTMPGTWETSANQLTLMLTGPTGEPSTLVYDYDIDGDILALEWAIGTETECYAEFTRQ
jgi:hypothetical protein